MVSKVLQAKRLEAMKHGLSLDSTHACCCGMRESYRPSRAYVLTAFEFDERTRRQSSTQKLTLHGVGVCEYIDRCATHGFEHRTHRTSVNTVNIGQVQGWRISGGYLHVECSSTAKKQTVLILAQCLGPYHQRRRM